MADRHDLSTLISMIATSILVENKADINMINVLMVGVNSLKSVQCIVETLITMTMTHHSQIERCHQILNRVKKYNEPQFN
jgi:hypothetical protein